MIKFNSLTFDLRSSYNIALTSIPILSDKPTLSIDLIKTKIDFSN